MKPDFNDYVELGDEPLHSGTVSQNDDYIAHYGRLGMKWYKHIYGDYYGNAKYAKKGKAINAKLSKKKDLTLTDAAHRYRKMEKNAKVINEADKQNHEILNKHLSAGRYKGSDKKLADDVGKGFNKNGLYYTRSESTDTRGLLRRTEYDVRKVDKEWAKSHLKAGEYDRQTKEIAKWNSPYKNETDIPNGVVRR